jgi:hypothetical protein
MELHGTEASDTLGAPIFFKSTRMILFQVMPWQYCFRLPRNIEATWSKVLIKGTTATRITVFSAHFPLGTFP